MWLFLCFFQFIFIYLGFYVAFNTVQVISRRVVGRAEETSTYSLLALCTVNCRPTASNYQLSHLRPSRGSNPGLRGGRRECYHSATVAPFSVYKTKLCETQASELSIVALLHDYSFFIITYNYSQLNKTFKRNLKIMLQFLLFTKKIFFKKKFTKIKALNNTDPINNIKMDI